MKLLYASDEFGGVTTTFIRNELLFFSTVASTHYLCLHSAVRDFNNGKVSVSVAQAERVLWRRKLNYWLWKWDLLCRRKDPDYKKALAKLLTGFNPDIIHCHFAYEGLRVLDNLSNTNLPVILHFHGYDASQMLSKRSYVARLKEFSERNNVYALYCSRDIKVKLAQRGVQFPNSTVIYWGIDTDHFTCDSTRNRFPDFTLIQVASFTEKKGQEYTLRAFAESPPRYKLILVGDGPMKQAAIDLAKSLGIMNRVNFTGSLDQNETRKLYAQSHAFIHPSITAANGDQEGIPTSMMEAMAMGLPVISTRHSGIPELVTDGVNGILVNEREVAALADAIRKIQQFDVEGVNPEKIRQQFNIKRHNNELHSLYKSILHIQ